MEIKPARNQVSTAACAKAAIRSAMGNDGYWPHCDIATARGAGEQGTSGQAAGRFSFAVEAGL